MLILAAALAALAAVSTVAAAQVPAASSYDPVQAGAVPPGYYQSVPRGMIRAVYAPRFRLHAGDRRRAPGGCQGVSGLFPELS